MGQWLIFNLWGPTINYMFWGQSMIYFLATHDGNRNLKPRRLALVVGLPACDSGRLACQLLGGVW